MDAASGWSSLEVAKLLVGALTPILVLVLTVVVSRASRRTERAERDNRRAIERLLELHQDMAPLMNDLFCFFTRVGHFRDLDPPDVVTTKRRLDKVFHVNEHLFGPRFRDRYREFMDACFALYQGGGADARLKTSVARLIAERGDRAWDDSWGRLFIDRPADEHGLYDAQRRAYHAAMEEFAAELGLRRPESPDS